MTGVGFSGPSPGPSAVAGWRAAKSCLPCARRLATSSHLELKTALGGKSGTRIQTARRGQGKRTTEGPPASERGPRVPSGLMVASPLTAGSSGATHSTPTRTVLHPSTLFGDGFCRRWQSLPLECIWFYEDLSCPSGKTKIRAGYHNRKA